MMVRLEEIKPIGEKIVFRFLDDAREKGFTSKTSWNFVVKTHDDTTKAPRWAKVYAVGKDAPSDIALGDYILIEPLMWTHGFVLDEVKYWATDYSKIIGQLKEEPIGTF